MPPLPISSVFFDLDDTLYHPQCGLWREIKRRINRYMIERTGIRQADADALRKRFLTEYGTTCNGLRREFGADPGEFYRYVHDIPLEEFLAPDPGLRRMLQHMPQEKIIFSNADRDHILRVLSVLGVADLFDGIVDIFSTGFACKPMDAAYRIAARKAGSPPARRCMLVDDLARNLAPARGLGWTTVLIHHPDPDGAADHQIDAIHRLPDLLEP
jgi:putative hydrolase of the HAD superfamily